MTINDHSTKFKLPKPVYVPIKNESVLHDGNKGFNQNKKRLTNTRPIESRPRNVTDYEKGYKDVCENSWQGNYTKLHQRLIETNQNKFIVFKCPRSGWGNRLRDLITSFHFAVLTKRAFVLNCDFPSPLNRFLETRNINWNYKVNETGLTVRHGYKVILNDIKNASNPKTFEQMLNYSVEYNMELVGGKYEFIADHVRYDLPVWPNLHQMMGCSFYYLFRKSEMLQNSLDYWKGKLGFNKNIVIGIHIRQGDSVFHYNRRDKRIGKKDVDFNFDCAGQVQLKVEEKYNTKNVIWFLAADSQKMKDYASQEHGDKVRYISGPIEHVGHPSKGNEDAGHLSMFLDYFLLEEADYRLYAGPSSFDRAINFITLGSQNAGTSWNNGKLQCVMPKSL